jgi:predicted lipase
MLVLVFRGVLPWDTHKWISDISFTKKKYPYCDNDCFVHQGFLDSYEDVGNAVLSIVRNYTALFKMPKLYVVGHSLGAAIATHAVAHLVSKGIKVDRFYSLGSPRVGDPKFHDWFNRAYKGGYTARITHNKDPVPHLPPESLGFEHLNYEVEYP